MTTQILNGKALGQQWLALAAARVKAQTERLGRHPRLVIVQVADHPSSTAYVGKKLLAAAQIGVVAEKIGLAERDGEAALMSLLHALAHDESVDALLVQTPLPEGWDVQAALNAVPWRKDVDGLSEASATRRAQGLPCHLPATPAAVLRLLTEEWRLNLEGLPVAVIGNGRVVGAPLRALLAERGAQLICINRDTPAPHALCREARVVIAACGVPTLVTEHWLSSGAYVVDVGLTPEEDETGKRTLRGDVDALRIEGVAAFRTPVPGGVGPLTVAQLFTNVAAAPTLPEA